MENVEIDENDEVSFTYDDDEGVSEGVSEGVPTLFTFHFVAKIDERGAEC